MQMVRTKTFEKGKTSFLPGASGKKHRIPIHLSSSDAFILSEIYAPKPRSDKKHKPKRHRMKYYMVFIILFLIPKHVHSQNIPSGSSGEYLTLQQCIDYAMVHQPALNQANINVSITKL